MGAMAVPEMLLRKAKGFTDFYSWIEGMSDTVAKGKTREALTPFFKYVGAMSAQEAGIEDPEIDEILKSAHQDMANAFGGMKEDFYKDLSKGGVNTSSTVLNALMPGAAAGELRKATTSLLGRGRKGLEHFTAKMADETGSIRLGSDVKQLEFKIRTPEDVIAYGEKALASGETLTGAYYKLGNFMKTQGPLSENARLLVKARKSLVDQSDALKSEALASRDFKKLDRYAYLRQLAQGPSEALEALVGKGIGMPGTTQAAVTEAKELAQALLGNLKKNGGQIESYKSGIDYVPSNQLAYVHKGEAIIPAEYNKGGRIGFAEGGAVGQVLRGADQSGEKIANEIADKLSKVELKVADTTVELSTKTVELDTSSLANIKLQVEPVEIDTSGLTAAVADLKTALANPSNIRGVGSEESKSEMAKFIEKVDKTLNEYAAQQADVDRKMEGVGEKLKILDTSKPIEDLQKHVSDLEERMSDMYTNTQKPVDDTENRSYLERRLTELWADVAASELTPIESELSVLRSGLNNLSLTINDTLDRLSGLYNIVSITRP